MICLSLPCAAADMSAAELLKGAMHLDIRFGVFYHVRGAF